MTVVGVQIDVPVSSRKGSGLQQQEEAAEATQ
jgi:hypothetical protein